MIDKDMRQVFEALRDQEWIVEETNNNHYQATPPDKTKSIVHFAKTPSDHRAFANVIGELRRNGFLWPAPKKQRSTAPVVGQVVVDRPFPPPRLATPLGAMVKLEMPVPQPLREPLAVVLQPPVLSNEEQMFQELKEARDYARVARDELEECQARFAAALKAVENAQAEAGRALLVLAEKKAAFDRAFEAA